ncbi:MAG: GNAT family N-acetyltransferase [Gammaproteobacteria bacterium]|nr:GNAT family N-acetyltransferase [Gammaproteobacteria bacterium]
MSDIKILIREYRDTDYTTCEALVSEVWSLDVKFQPQEFSTRVKNMYTQGSVIGSNFRVVLEINGRVVGFLFGLNEQQPKPDRDLIFESTVLWKILNIDGLSVRDKENLFSAINQHEKNRLAVMGRDKSEVVLCVVSPLFQKNGYGKKLIYDFITHCKNDAVESIVVEANNFGSGDFYQAIGFQYRFGFDSPLHEYMGETRAACMYEYRIS